MISLEIFFIYLLYKNSRGTFGVGIGDGAIDIRVIDGDITGLYDSITGLVDSITGVVDSITGVVDSITGVVDSITEVVNSITRAVLVGVTNDGNVGGDGVTDTTEKDKLIVHGFHALKTRMSNAINLMVLLIELRIM